MNQRTTIDPRTTTRLDKFDWTADRTYAEWEEMAAKFDQESEGEARDKAASFDSCDTDGFLSQWASDVVSRQYMAAAMLARAHGLAEHDALFDAETGELVAAKIVDGNYGQQWAILNETNPGGRPLRWITRSTAETYARQQKFYRRKGFTLGRVLAPSQIEVVGSNATAVARRIDGGHSREVYVITAERVDEPVKTWAQIDAEREQERREHHEALAAKTLEAVRAALHVLELPRNIRGGDLGVAGLDQAFHALREAEAALTSSD